MEQFASSSLRGLMISNELMSGMNGLRVQSHKKCWKMKGLICVCCGEVI